MTTASLLFASGPDFNLDCANGGRGGRASARREAKRLDPGTMGVCDAKIQRNSCRRAALPAVAIALLATAFAGTLAWPPAARASEDESAAPQATDEQATKEPASPLDEELAAKKAAIEAATEPVPQPAPVPLPPEQTSGEEALIELPIAPSGKAEDKTGEANLGGGDGPETAAGVSLNDVQSLRVLFAAETIDIARSSESELRLLAGQLVRNQGQRVVLRAHAASSDQGGSHARRLSLSRALAVRAFLVDQGVAANRIFLRPLGSDFKDGPPDRVDILPLRP